MVGLARSAKWGKVRRSSRGLAARSVHLTASPRVVHSPLVRLGKAGRAAPGLFSPHMKIRQESGGTETAGNGLVGGELLGRHGFKGVRKGKLLLAA